MLTENTKKVQIAPTTGVRKAFEVVMNVSKLSVYFILYNSRFFDAKCGSLSYRSHDKQRANNSQ